MWNVLYVAEKGYWQIKFDINQWNIRQDIKLISEKAMGTDLGMRSIKGIKETH